MRTLLASLATVATLLPALWFTVNPTLGAYCVPDGHGSLVPSHSKTFVTSATNGSTVPVTDSPSQVGLCATIQGFPL